MQAAPRSSGQRRDGGREAPSAVAASERPAGMGEGRATSLKMHHGIKPGLAIRFLYDIIHVSTGMTQRDGMEREVGGGVQDWEHVYTRRGFMLMYGKTNKYCKVISL